MANHAKERAGAEDPDVLQLRDWFAGKDCEMVARRNEVFALLGHYHNTQVKPHLTLRGNLLRLWWRITGQKFKRMDWWELFDARKEEIRLRRQARAELERELAGTVNADTPAPPPRILP